MGESTARRPFKASSPCENLVGNGKTRGAGFEQNRLYTRVVSRWTKAAGILLTLGLAYLFLATPFYTLIPRTWTLRIPPTRDARLRGEWYWAPNLEIEKEMILKADGTGRGAWGPIEWGTADGRLHLRIRSNEGWYGESSLYTLSPDQQTLTFTDGISALQKTIRRKRLVEPMEIGLIKGKDAQSVLESLDEAGFEHLALEPEKTLCPLVARAYQIDDAPKGFAEPSSGTTQSRLNSTMNLARGPARQSSWTCNPSRHRV